MLGFFTRYIRSKEGELEFRFVSDLELDFFVMFG